MDIRIKTTDYEMTPEAQVYLDEKIAAIEKSLKPKADEMRLEVEVGRAPGHAKRGDVWLAEMNLFYESKTMRAHAEEESVNAAIDCAKDDIVRQYRKSRQLHRRLLRRGNAAVKWITHFGRES